MGPEKCPFCGQEIDTEAAKCFFCGAELDEASVEKRIEQLEREDSKKPALKTKCPLVLQLIVFFILIFVALFSGTSKRKPESLEAGTSEQSAVRLNAKVTPSGSQFTIVNNDSFDWTNVELQIISKTAGSNFILNVPKIPSGETYTLRAAEFTMKDGTRFNPYTMKPDRFWIWCETPNTEKGSYVAGFK